LSAAAWKQHAGAVLCFRWRPHSFVNASRQEDGEARHLGSIVREESCRKEHVAKLRASPGDNL
jgi:hypothetical protein